MLSHLPEQTYETEIAYWRSRVTSLEVLVCELLAKNQHLRFVQEPANYNHPIDSTLHLERATRS